MAEQDPDRLTWVGEMPVPTANVLIHFEGYVLEQWLRRIALASLMAKAGSRWMDAVPEGIIPDAKKQVNLLRKRTYLDPENSDNLIWAVTLDQLRQVLTDKQLYPFVYELTGTPKRDLYAALETFRDIRNIVAHHRATNEVALENFRLLAKRLGAPIRRFKRSLLYWETATVIHGAGSEPDTDVSRVFEASGLATDRWFLLSERERFHAFGVVYGDPVLTGGFVDLGNLLDLFHDVRRSVLCVQLAGVESEGYGGELNVVWPKDVAASDLEVIRDACLSIRRDSEIPYEEQDPKHVCDPLIWFEHGRTGAAAAGVTEAQRWLESADPSPSDAADDDIPF